MDISILSTDPQHPVIRSLKKWVEEMTVRGHNVKLLYDKGQLEGGDILFLVSCGQLVGDTERKKFNVTLVLHASDLPKGRGWSPHIWSILDGKKDITVSLLEATDPVDTGQVWLKERFCLEGHELLPEINEKLFKVELSMMSSVVENYKDIKKIEQSGDPGPYLRKRTPEDSRLDPDKTIGEQFDLLRVVDSQRFPAFFDFRGKRYLITIEKEDNG